MQPRTPQKWQIRSVALISVGALGILALLFLGPQGSYITEVLALLLAFLTVSKVPKDTLWSIFQYVLLIWRNLPKKTRLLSSTIFFALGIGALGFFPPQGPVTQFADQARIKGGDVMVNGSEASIRFVEKIPNRDNMGLTLHLENIIGTGDCYQSSMITLRPTVNGEPKPLVNTRGRESRATIDIGREVRDLVISVKLQVDEGCRIKIKVTNAAFYD